MIFEQQEGGFLPAYKLAILDGDKNLGFYLLIPQAIDIYEVHTHMEPEAYGSASDISKRALKEVFNIIEGMNTLVTKVPVNNPLAKQLSLSVGMKQYGMLPKSFNGIDQELFYIQREDM